MHNHITQFQSLVSLRVDQQFVRVQNFRNFRILKSFLQCFIHSRAVVKNSKAFLILDPSMYILFENEWNFFFAPSVQKIHNNRHQYGSFFFFLSMLRHYTLSGSSTSVNLYPSILGNYFGFSLVDFVDCIFFGIFYLGIGLLRLLIFSFLFLSLLCYLKSCCIFIFQAFQ